MKYGAYEKVVPVMNAQCYLIQLKTNRRIHIRLHASIILGGNEIYFPKEHRFIVLLLQHGCHDHTLLSAGTRLNASTPIKSPGVYLKGSSFGPAFKRDRRLIGAPRLIEKLW